MQKFKLVWCSILAILLFVAIDTSLASAAYYQDWEEKTNVDPHHNWTIKFNYELDMATIDKENIYIQANGEDIPDIDLSLGTDKKSINIAAPKSGYEEQKTYVLYVEKAVKSITGKELNSPIKMKFTVGQANLASKLLIKVRGTETPEELWTLLDQSPYLTKFSNDFMVRHKVSDKLNSEIYNLFGAETKFSYGFYNGLLSDLGYNFTANEQLFSVLKQDLISLFGAPYKDPYANNSEHFLEWRIFGKGNDYGYGRVVLYLDEYSLTLTQVTL